MSALTTESERKRTGRRVSAEDLDPRAVLCIQHRDIRDRDVRNDVRLSGVLAKTTDGDTVRAVAPHVLYEDVGAVRLECWGVDGRA